MKTFEKSVAARRRKIARENDELRRYMIGENACVVATRSVSLSPDCEKIIEAVRKFDDFGPDNDPYGEHDFGSMEVNGTKYFWKIDYYDESFKMGVDPWEDDPHRVLTIMRADEY